MTHPRPTPGFVAGVRALFSGFGFLFGTPALWPFAMVPVLIASILSVAFGVAAWEFVPRLVSSVVGPPSSPLGGAGSTAAEILATVLAMGIGIVTAFALAQPLSGPALEKIVRRRESAMGIADWPKTGLLQDVARSLQSVLVSGAFGLPPLALLFVVSAFVPGAVVVTVPLKVVVTAMLIAWDLCDYPLSIRGVPVGARVRLMARHSSAMLGFGAALAVASLFLPCSLLLVLPAGVAGATRLVAEIEAASRPMRAP